MADRGADPGVLAGLQRLDAADHLCVELLVEILDGRHVRPRLRRRDVKVKMACSSPQAVRPCVSASSALLLDVEDPPVLEPGVGRQRDVHQHGDREVAGDGAGVDEDPLRPGAAGAPVGDIAHQGREIEIVAVRFAAS